MNEAKENRLPPIVSDYIKKLSDPKQSKFVRESYCMVLEHIIKECTDAVNFYKKETAPRVAKRK